MNIADVFVLLGGVALFLFGMSIMGDSLKKVAGSKLELFLYKLTNTPLKGILLGCGVTAIIQSSSATSAMVVGFVNSGMMKLKQAIGIIMGAIIGTSITGWIISLSYIGSSDSSLLQLLSTESLTAIVALIGIILYMFVKKNKNRHIGEILLGFAVLMMGMKSMSGAVSGLREAEGFLNLLTNFSNPLLGIIFGLIFTSVIQSASAAVGIIQALSVTGVISLDIALPVLMGISIGASVPVIISSVGASKDSQRAAYSYLGVSILGTIITSIIYYVLRFIGVIKIGSMILNPISIATVNTLFRLLVVVLLTPFISLIEKMMTSIIKDDLKDRAEYIGVEQLEERFIQYPPLAVEHTRLAINAMSSFVRDILAKSISLLDNYNDDDFKEIDKTENIIDEYEDRIGTYLSKLTGVEMSKDESEAVAKYLHAITDLERISDHSFNLAELAAKAREDDIVFTDKGKEELKVMYRAIGDIIDLTLDSFISEDIDSACLVEPFEELIDNLIDQMKDNHVKRLQKGECSLSNGYVFNDILTDLERISDHCSNIALAVIELSHQSLEFHDYIIKLRETKVFEENYHNFSQKYILPND